ncbi:restriction endonuclease subunit S [Desulfomicrobium salsuginis]
MKNGWQIKRLGDVVTRLTNGYVGPTRNIYVESGIPYLLARHVRNNNLSFDGKTFISEEFNQKNKKSTLKVGDVLLVQSGHIGHSAVVTEEHEGHNCHAMIVITPLKDVITGPFLSFFFNSPDMQQGFEEIRSGSTVPHLTCGAVKELQVPIPPLFEQQRIVAILDEAFAGLATAKANAEKNLQNARALFESYLQSVFFQRGKGWVEKTLEEIGKTQTGSTPKTSDQSNYGDFISFVKPGDFNKDGTLDYNKNRLSESGAEGSRIVPAGSVLMVCIGATIGKCGYCEQSVTTNQQVNALTPSDGSSNRFIYYQMLTETFQRKVIDASGQATLPIINKSKWSALSVWLPPTVAEQKTIAAKLDALSEETQRLAHIYERKLAALDALKQSLLHQAFSGQL